MSILKFRYWDPFNGVMVYSEDAKNLRSFFAGYEQAVKNGNEPIMMQCTGLKDKNNREIYEGDICYTHNISDKPIYRQVCYCDGCFIWDDDEDDLLRDWYLDKIEIIGNIYDNPELLEVKES